MIESDGYRKYPDGTCYKIPQRPKNFQLNTPPINSLFGDKLGNNLASSTDAASYEHSTHTFVTPATQSTVHHNYKKAPDVVPKPTVNNCTARMELDRSKFGFDEFKADNSTGKRDSYNRVGVIHLSMLDEFKGMELPRVRNYNSTNLNGSMIPNLTTVQLGDVNYTKYNNQPNLLPNANTVDKKKRYAEYDVKDENTVKIDNNSMQKHMRDTITNKNRNKRDIDIRIEKADSFQTGTYNATIKTYKNRKDEDCNPITLKKKVIEEEDEHSVPKRDKRDIYNKKPVLPLKKEEDHSVPKRDKRDIYNKKPVTPTKQEEETPKRDKRDIYNKKPVTPTKQEEETPKRDKRDIYNKKPAIVIKEEEEPPVPKRDKRDIYNKKPAINITPVNNNKNVTPINIVSPSNNKPQISPASNTKNDPVKPAYNAKPQGIQLFSYFSKKKPDNKNPDTLNVQNNVANTTQVKSNRDMTPTKPQVNLPASNSDRKIDKKDIYNKKVVPTPQDNTKKPEITIKTPESNSRRPDNTPKKPEYTPKRPSPSPQRKDDSPAKPETNVSTRRQTNNWVIQSFLPSQAGEQNIDSLGTSISFIGESRKYDALIRQLKKSKAKYVDEDFYHDWDSLWGFGESRNYSMRKWKSDYRWARAEDIFKDKYLVYDNYIDPCDIMQGALGDCYFLSAIAAICEFQNRIKKLFLTREVNEQCVYCIA